MNFIATLICAVFLAVLPLSAQQLALDWTRQDCDGNTVHLYERVNAGDIYVIEYVMMNCAPCVTAAKGLSSVVSEQMNAGNNRVKLLSVGYLNNQDHNCVNLKQWREKYSFSHAVMPGGEEDIGYYGGMGMPTIVVVGKGGKVYYLRQGYAPSHNSAIRNAIEQATNDVVSSTDEYSVPTHQTTVVLTDNTVVVKNLAADQASVVVRTLIGNTVFTGEFSANETTIPTSNFAHGAYILTVTYNNNTLPFSTIIVR